MEKEEKYVVIRRTYSVLDDKPCEELTINYLSSKNAYGTEVWNPQISKACRIPIEYPKYFGFENNVEGFSDSVEYGVSRWKQEIIEADYIKKIHRLI